MTDTLVRKPTFYNSVWRWHFYAGLFCIPFVIWLALTGAIYLWRPQIEAWLDRPYTHLALNGAAATPDAQVAAALEAVPGSSFAKYELPQAFDSAVQILVQKDGEASRVYVHPATAEVLNVAVEESRPLRLVFHLHGELLAGPVGSYLVEIAACWAIVMIVTGLYLWWPRSAKGVAGVLYPRLRSGSRIFWRDIHATTGIWVSFFALILILTGLPWAKAWGSYLGEIRQITGTASGPIDWTIGGKAPDAGDGGGEHAGHMGMGHMAGMAMPVAEMMRPGDLMRVITAAVPAGLAPPVQISPPKKVGGAWSVSSNAADRPLRGDMKVDGATGRVISRTDFEQRHWIDQMVGYGVAVHEGALFGLLNQIIGTLTALFLVMLAVSGMVMWWRRRPTGLLGAPIPLSRPRFGLGLIAIIVALGIYLPMFGATLLLVLATEKLLLVRVPGTRRWLGLRAPAVA
ncbi:PepSY domain-containing protein [Sphingomonas sp.]|uniref:PepSY-associated TM helix domain-containing protein n=1 Tax=Sphingomonas sp. TaxID=28214 RepID=UPI000DAFDDF8|nr:PepSY domain-containing protein [Sphingomonas sp.]PZU11632.1 MAG: peptidase [Sphingomonas sp.]